MGCSLHLITVERLRTSAEVDGTEPRDDLGWHQPYKRFEVSEAAQGTSQPT
jgi:hypothetical protein